MTTIADLRNWFQDGVENGATHMIVVCDTFDHEDYPAYAYNAQDCLDKYDKYNGKNMQRVMEVYDLAKPWDDANRSRRMELP